MWNCRVLKPPLYCEIKTTLKQSEIGSLYGARMFLKKSKGSVSDHMKLLTTEHYMVKRIIYKLVNQFRSDKALKTLKQVHTCMKRLEGVNVEKQMTESLQLVDRSSCNRDDTEFYFPSRQVLEHQLVMLQGIGALLRQTVQYCQKTFLHVRQHLELGNMIPQNLLMLALISRIWYVCNSLGLYVCNWYRGLYSCLSFFKPTAVPWLQKDELPKDLTAWLSEHFKETEQPEQNLMESVEGEKSSGSLPANVQFLELADQEDVGEPIRRKTVVEESDNLRYKTSTVPDSAVAMYRNKRKIEKDDKDDEDETETSTKKKQKILIKSEKTSNKGDTIMKIESTRESDSDSNVRSDDDNEMGKMHESSLDVNFKDTGSIEDKVPAKVADVDISNVTDVKAHLQNVLQTAEDFDNFVQQIKTGTFKICETCCSFSNMGKKKILKNIGKWRNSMTNKATGLKTEQIFLKKVRGPLSELIVKLNLTPMEGKVKTKMEPNSDEKVDKDYKQGVVSRREIDQQESDHYWLKNEQEDVQVTSDITLGLDNHNQSAMKRKQKKNDKKVKAEVAYSTMTGTMEHSETKEAKQTVVKSSSSRRRRGRKTKKK